MSLSQLGGFSVVLAIEPRTEAAVGRSAEGLGLHGVVLGKPRVLAAPCAPGVNAGWAITVLAVLYQALHRFPLSATAPT